jgi:AraC-like DNA-binding protein
MSELINISALYGYLECAEALQLDPRPLLDECGIDHQMLVRQEGVITFTQVTHLLDLSAEKSHCPHFGLLMSQQQNLPIFGMLGLLIEKSPDLRSALNESIRYFHLHTPAAAVELEEGGDLALLKYRVLVDLTSTKQPVDLTIGTMNNCLRLLNGRNWKARSIYLSHSPAGDRAIYRRILGAPITYDHELNAVVFDRQLLDVPMKEHNPTLQRVLKRQVEMESREAVTDITGVVRKMIHNRLPFSDCSLEVVAKQLAVSPRTLQYRLSEQATTFKQLVDEVRRGIAQQQLQQSHVPISQLCDLLGYSDQTAFSRAFKRWFGVSPREWQKTNKAG